VASIELTGIWLALLSDLAIQLHFTKVELDNPQGQVPGDFRLYANGVVRLMTSVGKLRSVPVKLHGVSRTDRETLEDWQGQLMLYRDSRGRILYGSFLDLGGPDKRGSEGLADLSFTFTAITHSPEV
jgi:hypothetical protein